MQAATTSVYLFVKVMCQKTESKRILGILLRLLLEDRTVSMMRSK